MRDNYDLIYAEVDLGISRDICRLGSALSLSSDALLEAENPRVAKGVAVEHVQDDCGCSSEDVRPAWSCFKL